MKTHFRKLYTLYSKPLMKKECKMISKTPKHKSLVNNMKSYFHAIITKIVRKEDLVKEINKDRLHKYFKESSVVKYNKDGLIVSIDTIQDYKDLIRVKRDIKKFLSRQLINHRQHKGRRDQLLPLCLLFKFRNFKGDKHEYYL